MVQKFILADDLYDSKGQTIEADDTVYFWWDGDWYEIDLTRGNQVRMADDIGPYLALARKRRSAPPGVQPVPDGIKAAKARRRRQPRGGDRRDWSGFKAWCQANGRSFTLPGGGFYPRVQDVADYEKWLAGSADNLPSEGEAQDSAQPAA